jgi:hypothetical protein
MKRKEKKKKKTETALGWVGEGVGRGGLDIIQRRLKLSKNTHEEQKTRGKFESGI